MSVTIPTPAPDTPINRAEALAQGARYYLTDTPCVRGHHAWRSVEGRRCMACVLDEIGKGHEWNVDMDNLPTRLSVRLRLRRRPGHATQEGQLSATARTFLARKRGRTIAQAVQRAIVPMLAMHPSERVPADEMMIVEMERFIRAMDGWARRTNRRDLVPDIRKREEQIALNSTVEEALGRLDAMQDPPSPQGTA